MHKFRHMANRFFIVAQQGNNNITAFLSTSLMTLGSYFLGQLPISYLLAKAGLQHIEYTDKVAALVSYPVFFSLIMLQFVLAFITLLFCVWVLHGRHPRTLFTGFPKFVKRNFLVGIFITSAMFLIFNVINYQLDPSDFIWQFNPEAFYPFLVVALLFFPIQIAFEEIFVRGYLMQFATVKTRNILFGWILTSVIFGGMHMLNQEVKNYGVLQMLLIYSLMGMALGYTVIKTEGLEFALGYHLINNLHAALVKTYPGSSLQTPAIYMAKPMDNTNVFSSLIPAVIIVIIVSILYRKKSLKSLFSYADATIMAGKQSIGNIK